MPAEIDIVMSIANRHEGSIGSATYSGLTADVLSANVHYCLCL